DGSVNAHVPQIALWENSSLIFAWSLIISIFVCCSGEFHLGYNKSQMKNLSWYDIVHWENLTDAQSKHRLSKCELACDARVPGEVDNALLSIPPFLLLFAVTQSEQERSCILLLRLQTSSMNWIWVH